MSSKSLLLIAFILGILQGLLSLIGGCVAVADNNRKVILVI